jgi:hypothetical protein
MSHKARRILAGTLFTGGCLWAVFTVGLVAEAWGRSRNMETDIIHPLIFCVAGLTIWAAWGAVAFGWLRQGGETFAWCLSAIYHAIFVWMIVKAAVTGHMVGGGLALDWWIAAFTISVVALAARIWEARTGAGARAG